MRPTLRKRTRSLLVACGLLGALWACESKHTFTPSNASGGAGEAGAAGAPSGAGGSGATLSAGGSRHASGGNGTTGDAGTASGGSGGSGGAGTASGGTVGSGGTASGGTTSRMDACLTSPCENGGTCVVEGEGYNCECADGFEGDHCESNIDDCDPDPCQNGGTCTDGVDDYSCECPSEWGGDNCEVELSWCEQRMRPPGVDAADYTCADLDDGMPAGWTPSTGGGSLRSNERASSPSYSWKSVVSQSAHDGSLSWVVAGSDAATLVTVRAEVNNTELPGPVGGYWVNLMCIEFGDGTACLQSNGLNTLEVAWQYLGSVARAGTCSVSAGLVAGTWQDLSMSFAQASGAIELRINETPVTSGCQVGLDVSGGTVVDVSVGASEPTLNQSYTAYFDNIEAGVAR